MGTSDGSWRPAATSRCRCLGRSPQCFTVCPKNAKRSRLVSLPLSVVVLGLGTPSGSDRRRGEGIPSGVRVHGKGRGRDPFPLKSLYFLRSTFLSLDSYCLRSQSLRHTEESLSGRVVFGRDRVSRGPLRWPRYCEPDLSLPGTDSEGSGRGTEKSTVGRRPGLPNPKDRRV